MNLPNGKYIGVATAASIYESTGGALMVALSFDILSEGHVGDSITARECLGKKDGTISEITYETLKQCFGWSGVDIFELVDAATSGALKERPVELVIEEETFTGRDGTQKTGARVRYINPLGGAGRLPECADRGMINAKYGARLRAMSGNTSTTNSTVGCPPKASEAPKPPAARSAPVTGCTKEVAWQAACTVNSALSDADLNALWFKTLASLFPGKPEADLTPANWQIVRNQFDDAVPY